MRIFVDLALLLCVSTVVAEDEPKAKKKDGPSAGAPIRVADRFLREVK